ncbi:MAG: MqnA/MqnD/SBP family protein [Sulfuricurvum sp.]
MIFGKIDFLNLLPFHVFMKRYARSLRIHQSLHYHRGVPSALNRDFAMRRIDAAFISSITTIGRRHYGIGIVAKKEVLSVLTVPSDQPKNDADSATSNRLAQVLDITGDVLIGDKALRHYYSGEPFNDLGKIWNDKTGLPFVFALLCGHGYSEELQRLSKAFVSKKTKIPHYLLLKASKSSHLSPLQILDYLNYITYEISQQEKRGLKRFIKEAKERGVSPSRGEIRYR